MACHKTSIYKKKFEKASSDLADGKSTDQ
ncbi:unnamed protein product [Ectocarpus sp. CCAP 1310/34]|nr:unnamed protein product [Ectocarpus sp. CCAP 1310/34]